MNKRVEKNQRIYEYVNAEISKKAKQNSNENFKNANNTLKDINPALFGDNISANDKPKKIKSSKKNLIITSIIFVCIVFLLIMLAVVIFIWNNLN